MKTGIDVFALGRLRPPRWSHMDLNLVQSCSQMCPTWGPAATSWSQAGPKLGPSGSKLGRSWGLAGRSWPQVLRTCWIETVHLDDMGPICKMRKLPQSCTFWRLGLGEHGIGPSSHASRRRGRIWVSMLQDPLSLALGPFRKDSQGKRPCECAVKKTFFQRPGLTSKLALPCHGVSCKLWNSKGAHCPTQKQKSNNV